MKKAFFELCALTVLTLGGAVQADLNVIGTAAYNGSDYNLVWQHDASGTSIIWLDYSNPTAFWGNQMSWAAGLNSVLTYNIDSQYTVTWSGDWRLPTAGIAPAYGCLAATQELGRLYYDELGFTGGSSNDGVGAPDLAGSIFENLQLAGYWTSTEGEPLWSTNPYWMFAFRETRSTPYSDTVYGFQDVDATGTFMGFSIAVKHYGIAAHNADVGVVPVPGAVILGLLGLGTAVSRLRKHRIA